MDTQATTGTSQAAPPVAVFQGYDTITSGGRSTAVTGNTGNAGAVSQLYYKVCYNSKAVQEALKVSGSVSASFGFGTGSAKADYVDELSVTNTCVSIVVYSNRIVSSETYTDVALIGEPPTAEHLNEFFQVYGDSFLTQLTLGAEYMATYVFYSQTREEQKRVHGELEACGIGESGAVDTSFQSNLNRAQQTIQTRQTLEQLITGFTNLAYPPADQICEFAANFSSLTPDAPTVVSFQTLGYEHVPGLQEVFKPIVATRLLYEKLAKDYATLVQVHNQSQWLSKVYAVYAYSGDTATAQNDQVVLGDIETLDALFAQMEANPTLTYHIPVLLGLNLGSPVLQSVASLVGPFGPDKGTPFSDPDDAWVQNAYRISELRLYGDKHLTAVEVTYESPYTGTKTFKHGKGAGKKSLPLTLGPGMFIYQVSGRYNGDFLMQLSFAAMSVDGQTVPPLAWPSDVTSGTPFFWGRENNTPLIALAGRAGNDLNQIAPVIATLSPAIWAPYQPPLSEPS